jgi:hypothetical protein
MLADVETAHGLRWTALRYFNASGADPGGGIGECHEPETHLIPVALEAAAGLRDQLSRVVIIVDGSKLNGTTWQQLGDYLAVVSLAQVNPNADPSEFDSILNLFTNRAAYSGLTDWDRTYVHSLYDINLERFGENQRSAIVGRMVRRDRAAAEAELAEQAEQESAQ